MPIEVPCPGCGSKLRAPDEKAGKKARCKKCNTSFRLPGVPVDTVGESQMLSAITIPAPPLPGDEDVPLAAAVEEPDDLASLPSADPFDFSAPVAKTSAPPVPPAATPTARPAFGSAKAAPPPAPPAPPKAKPKPVAKTPIATPAPPLPPPPPAKAPPPVPAAKAPPPIPAAANAAPEVLSLDDAEPVSPPPKKKAEPPTPPPIPVPAPVAAAPEQLPSDPFDFSAAPEPRAEDKPKKKRHRDDEDDDEPRAKRRKREEEDDEDDRPRSKKRSRDEDDDRPAPAKKAAAPEAEPELLDAEPVPAEPEPVAAAPAPVSATDDPFAFNFGGGPAPAEEHKPRHKHKHDHDEDDKPRAKHRKRDEEEDDEDDRPRGKHKDKPRDEEPDADDGPRYLRPDQRGSGKNTLLIAGILGAVAILAVVAAIIVMNGKKKEAEEAKRKAEEEAAAAKAKRDEAAPPPVVPPVEPPKKDAVEPPKKELPKKEPVEPPKKDPVEPPKKEPVPPGAPLGAALDLPKATRSFAFQPPRAKLELAEKPVRAATAVEVPFAKAKHVFAPKKRDQDAVVVWVSNPGVGGKGERIGVDAYSPAGVRVDRFEYAGDGRGGVCDVSQDGKFFVASGADQKLTVWNLVEKSKVLEDFDPYADKPEEKKAGIAAVFFTAASDRFLTVSTAGSVHVFEVAGKKVVGSFQPTPVLVPNRVALGTSVAIDEEHASLALAVGDTVYQIRTEPSLDVAWKLQLGEVARPLGIATHGVPGYLAYAFETTKKERAILFVNHERDARAAFRWPDAAGEPRAVHWAGGRLAVVATDRGAVYVEVTDAKQFTPFALAEVTGGKGPHAATENGHWYLTAHPTDPNKSALVELSTDAISDFRNSIDGKELPTVKLSDKGLSR